LENYCKDIREKYSFGVEPVKTPFEAIDGCDIVVTAGSITQKPQILDTP